MEKMKKDIVIKCTNCNTNFKVNISDIGENGRMVSCSVCEYEWLYIPKKSSPIKELKELAFFDEIEEKAHEVAQKNPIFLIAIINLLLLSVFLSIFLYMERSFLIKQHHKMEAFYKMFDYHNTDGLELKIMKLRKLRNFEGQDNQQKQYEIPIKIINHTNKTKFLPIIRVIGYGKNCSNVINLFTNIRRDIMPNSALEINLKTDPIVEKIDFIIAKMGNIQDLRNFDYNMSFCHIKQ